MDTSKIIKGVVNSGRYTVTAPIVKEDYGLYLQIEGVELPSTYEVDFSNSEHNGTSVTMIGNSDGVLIPHQFIDTGKDIFAFLYHVGEGFGRTVYKFRIPNKVRPDRTDDTPTPEQASVIDQAISALNEAVEQTAQDVIDADASAQSASQSAENAHDSAVDAQNYAESASGYASDAQGYATTASQKATAAGNSADQAAQIKTDIEGYVSTAQGYAQTATDKAAQASQSATNASTSATTATTKAGEASASATTASTKASEASGYASTASQKATESAQSATNASQSAQTALQAKTDAQTAKTQAESARDTAVQAKNDAESARDTAQTLVDGISGKVEQIDSNTERIESLEDDRYKPYVVDSASGSIASFPDGADGIPLKSLVVDIDPVQDLHGYDSPWVGGGGKNLLDPTLLKDQAGWNVIPIKVKPSTKYTCSTTDRPINVGLYIYFNNTGTQGGGSTTQITVEHPVTLTSTEDGYVYVTQRNSGTDSFANYHWQIEEGESATDWTPYKNICPISGWTGANVEQRGKNLFDKNSYRSYSGYFGSSKIVCNADHLIVYIPCKPNTTYTVSRQRTSTNERFAVSWAKVVPASQVTIYGIKSSANTGTVGDWMSLTITTGEDAKYLAVWAWWSSSVDPEDTLQIELGSTRTDYSAYTGRSITISLGQTVYGGKLDVLSGVLTVDRAMIASYNGETLPSTWISDRDAYAQGATPTTGAQVVYKLATPTTVQLTPHEVATLLGVNNIFADTGDTACEYRADTKLYINRLTEPDSADMIADANITSGQYFMVGNSLYKATANIANGAQIIVGTNCIRKSLSEALNEINA